MSRSVRCAPRALAAYPTLAAASLAAAAFLAAPGARADATLPPPSTPQPAAGAKPAPRPTPERQVPHLKGKIAMAHLPDDVDVQAVLHPHAPDEPCHPPKGSK